MMQYFIDIGNTQIKHTPNRLPFAVTQTAHQDAPLLLRALNNESPQQIMITAGRSPAAQKAQRLVLDFTSQSDISTHVITVNRDLLDINYAHSRQFGVDRFLGLLAGKARCRQNFCVVSAGTAITLDFYTHQHIGGMILPGLGSAASLLSDKAGLTALRKPDTLLGNDTASSIGAGLYIGLQNLIERSITRIGEHYSTAFYPLITGGDATRISPAGEIVPALIFEGMKYYSEATQ